MLSCQVVARATGIGASSRDQQLRAKADGKDT